MWIELALVGAASGTVITVLVSFVVSRLHLAEDPDRIWIVTVWLVAAVAVVASLLVVRRLPTAASRVPRGVLAGAAVAALALCVFLARVRNDPYGELWVGFSTTQIVLGSAIGVAAILVSRMVSARVHRVLFIVSASVVGIVTVAFLFQTSHTFVSNHDNSFTFEDLLAPAAGRMPGYDYVAQYSTLLGYPLALVRLLAPALFDAGPEVVAVTWVVGLQVVTIAAACAVVVWLAPRAVRWMVPAIIVPVAFLVSADGLLYYANLPLRFFLPTVMLVVVVWLRMKRGPISFGSAAVLGVLGGAAAFNNLDYGVAGWLAGGVLVVVSASSWRDRLSRGSIYTAASLIVPIVVTLVGFATGRSPRVEYFTFFVQTFGVEGFYSEPMPFFGLHVAFVFLGLLGAVLGALGARATPRRVGAIHQAILFQSAWLLFSLVYFSSRSLTPTLITGSCFLAGVLLALLVVRGLGVLSPKVSGSPRRWSLSVWLTAALTTLALGVAAASWMNFPSFGQLEAKLGRVSNPAPDAMIYLEPDPAPALKRIPDTRSLIGMLSVSGSTWQNAGGITNVSLFVHPNYLDLGNGAALQCEFLEGRPGDYLLTTDNLSARLSEEPRCDGLFDFDDEEFLSTNDTYAVDWVLVPRASR